MKTHKNLYEYLFSMSNLIIAWRNAHESKTQTPAVIDFERNLEKNLLDLHYELKDKVYKPKPLTTFVLRDPKTRVISKSDFRDRVIHHALILVIGRIFEKTFIYDSCANRIGKGNLFALERFDKFKRKITYNYNRGAFCLKADIKHYFAEVNHKVLLEIINRKIKDENVIWLIKQILGNCTNNTNSEMQRERATSGITEARGMPIGNLTSQFFANIYLNELDYFVKHKLKAEYYIRYVDDFVILHNSRKQLERWKNQIDNFLKLRLKLELHPEKSRIIPLSRGIDFVGFRNFYYHKLLRKRNIRNIQRKIWLYTNGKIGFESLRESYQGWNAYA